MIKIFYCASNNIKDPETEIPFPLFETLEECKGYYRKILEDESDNCPVTKITVEDLDAQS